MMSLRIAFLATLLLAGFGGDVEARRQSATIGRIESDSLIPASPTFNSTKGDGEIRGRKGTVAGRNADGQVAGHNMFTGEIVLNYFPGSPDTNVNNGTFDVKGNGFFQTACSWVRTGAGTRECVNPRHDLDEQSLDGAQLAGGSPRMGLAGP